MRTLGIAATGMQAQQVNVDVIANNIANANTTAFKAGRAAFADLIYQTMEREGAPNADGTVRPVGVDVGLGVRATGVVRLHTQGGLDQTDNQLDLAIDGEGYFVVTRPDGTNAYSRAGSLQLSPEGEIVTLEGYLLEPAMVVPDNTTEIEITQSGLVLAYTSDAVEPEEIGQITLATFINEAGLKPAGNNLMLETAASGEPMIGNPGEDSAGIIRQGYLERSNVDPIKQMTDLITAQRTYEMGAKALKAADEMMQTANQIR
ncbi:flagellar basal-body rod protein FlgG [Leisingera sp. XS_AS12]|uniref:flagellar basal-body rod protein FlgG n=1 Tax=Leisingera TaxID=191028 RepID=UPI00040EEDD6|nr:flagellar basal-body rod protein FlgG [Leisingera caerulea]